MRLSIAALAFSCSLLCGQTAAPPAQTTLFEQVTDPLTLSLVMNGAAQIAESTTDWHFTAGGKQFSVSPAQRAGWACGIGFAAITASHFKPKWRPYVAGVISAFNAYLGGQAYVNSLQHGRAADPPAAAATPKAAISLRFRR